MTTIDFQDNGKTKKSVQIPSSWDEMTDDQVRLTFRMYDEYANGKISPLKMNLEILFSFLGLEKKTPTGTREQMSSTCQNLYKLCEQCLAFLFNTGDDGILHLTYNSVRNSLPVVRGGVARLPLIGPASLLQDLTFGEFRHASTALNDFFSNSDMANLDECIAFLYRRRGMKANKAGRKIKSIETENFSDDVALASSIKPWQKTYIMMWFSSCLNYLQTGKLRLNGEDIEMKKLFSGSNSGTEKCTWNDLMVQLARENILGNANDVDDSPLFAVISIIWSNYKENKRYEKASKTH